MKVSYRGAQTCSINFSAEKYSIFRTSKRLMPTGTSESVHMIGRLEPSTT